MRKLFLLGNLLFALMISACSDERPEMIQFDDLNLSDTKTALKVAYKTVDGSTIPPATSLAPSTEYLLEITGDVPVGFRFRTVDGFSFVSSDQNIEVRTTNQFRIKTDAVENVDPFFSVYPVIKGSEGVYVKERAQLFLRSSLK